MRNPSYARRIGSVRNFVWAIAALFVVFAWAAGYGFWSPESPGGEFGSYFNLELPALTLLFGAPLALAAGTLLGSDRRRGRAFGYAALVAACLVLMCLTSFSFFGGFCLDPGEDVCVTTWPSRIAELGAALACVALGWLAQDRRERRAESRRTRDVKTLRPE
jgi:hypothetical protein